MYKIYFLEVEEEDEPRLRELTKRYDIEIFPNAMDEDEIIEKCSDADVLSPFIYSNVTKKAIDALPNLKLIATRSTGCDHIDVQHAEQKNIGVRNIPDYGSNTVAEHAFALIFAVVRRILEASGSVKKGNFSYKGLRGMDLKGKTIGVIGTGRIGLHLIQIAKGLDMNVIAYDVIKNKKAASELGFKYVPFEELLKSSDIISMHVPLFKSTYHLINKNNLSLIKRGAILINTSRGAVVSTEALIEGITKGIFKGIGLDVLEDERELNEDHPLLKRDNVVITPHTAFLTEESMARIIEKTIKNIDDFFDN